MTNYLNSTNMNSVPIDTTGTSFGLPGTGTMLQGSSTNPQATQSNLQLTSGPTAATSPDLGVFNSISPFSFQAPQQEVGPSQLQRLSDLVFTSGGGFGGDTGEVAGATTDGTAFGGQSAVDLAQINTERAKIQDRISVANKVFGTLFGDIDKVLADRAKQLESQFAQTTEQATRQASEEGQALNRAYGSRGLGSSDYRTDALNNLQLGLGDVLNQERQATDQQLAGIAETGATTRAGFQQQMNQLPTLLERAMASEDVSQLQSIVDGINDMIANANVSRAGLQTQEGFLGQINRQAPVNAERRQGVLDNLSVIASGLLPAEAKAEAARRIVQNSGLDQEEQDSIYQQFLSRLG